MQYFELIQTKELLPHHQPAEPQQLGHLDEFLSSLRPLELVLLSADGCSVLLGDQ